MESESPVIGGRGVKMEKLIVEFLSYTMVFKKRLSKASRMQLFQLPQTVAN